MTNYTNRFPLPDWAVVLTEDERNKGAHATNFDDEYSGMDWEATVRNREDQLVIAEQKLAETIRELFFAYQTITKLEKQLEEI